MAGVWDVSVIEKGLTAKKFLAWEAYLGLEPYGEERADYRAAMIAGMIFNMAVDVKDRKPYTEWLLKFEEVEQKKQPTPAQVAQKQLELLTIYARAHSGMEVVEDTSADKAEQARMRAQVVAAHAAMK